MKDDYEKVEKAKDFHELTKSELNDLCQLLWERSVKEKRELLWDLRCVYLGEG